MNSFLSNHILTYAINSGIESYQQDNTDEIYE